MRKISLVFCILLLSGIVVSCQKELKGDKKEVVDSDAQKFIDSAKIDDLDLKNALNGLVKDLKAARLWQKMDAVYPMVGGTAESVKWNLKDPRDKDEAFRLTVHGNPVISSTGILFPTTKDYGDSHVNDSIMEYNNNHVSYYSRTQNTVNGYDVGCFDGGRPFNQMAIYHDSNASDYFGFYRWGYKPAKTTGLFMLSATKNNIVWYENGVSNLEKGSAPVKGYTGYPVLIGWCRAARTGGQRECGFATIGKGLNAEEALTFYKIVEKFQSKLKREVS